MNATLRHFAVRFWLTAVFGAMACFVLLPFIQHLMGIDYLFVPATVMMVAAFLVWGWALARMATAMGRRHLKEAGVWERAGMDIEARAAYERAIAVLDSCLLSPAARRRVAAGMEAPVARFFVSRPAVSARAMSFVTRYLARHPEDLQVADAWIEHVLGGISPDSPEIDLLGRIGDAQPENQRVQSALAHHCLAHRWMDFIALQAYQRAWRLKCFSAEDVRQLAVLLMGEAHVSHWALLVYLTALSQAGGDSRQYLPAVAACCQHLPVSAHHRELRQMAEKVLSGLDARQRRQLSHRFRPPAGPLPETDAASVRAGRSIRPALSAAVSCLVRRLAGTLTTAGKAGRRGAGRLAAVGVSPRFRRRATGLLVIVLAVALGVVVFRTVAQFDKGAARQTPEAAPMVETTDRFTIQVAAYLKVEDARRFVEQLKADQLDAFWTVAASASRKWYQVKVSHFATKDQARRYGDELKLKGLINDFYVANFSAAQRKDRP